MDEQIKKIIDDKYKYKFIEDFEFNKKYLLCNTDGSKYQKYLVVYYKEDNNIKYKEVPDNSYLDSFNQIVKTYNVEEIQSTCKQSDNMYKELNYYHIDDVYFIKYIIDEELYELFKLNNDYEKKKKIFIDK